MLYDDNGVREEEEEDEEREGSKREEEKKKKKKKREKEKEKEKRAEATQGETPIVKRNNKTPSNLRMAVSQPVNGKCKSW